MRAQVTETKVGDSAMEFMRGDTYQQKRLFVPDRDMQFWMYHEQLCVARGGTPGGDTKVVGDVEVSDALVEQIAAFIRVRDSVTEAAKTELTALGLLSA